MVGDLSGRRKQKCFIHCAVGLWVSWSAAVCVSAVWNAVKGAVRMTTEVAAVLLLLLLPWLSVCSADVPLPAAVPCQVCGAQATLPHINCANMDCNELFIACPACKTKCAAVSRGRS